MKEILKNRNVTLQTFKEPSRLVGACTDLLKNETEKYMVSRTETEPQQVVLLAGSAYEGKISALDLEVSKPLLVETIELAPQTAAVRFEEVFRNCIGDPGLYTDEPNVEHTRSINYSGFQRKVTTVGTGAIYLTEVVEAEGGAVQVQHPILSTDSIAATAPSGSLQVSGDGGSKASLVLQGLRYESVVGASAANNITVKYLEASASVKASVQLPGVKLVAKDDGDAGNDITVEIVEGEIQLGEETLEVEDQAITITIAAGQTNAALIGNLVNNFAWAEEVLLVAEVTVPLESQVAMGATNLTGGADMIGAAGSEVVTVNGMEIFVQLESGVSTSEDVESAINGSADALKLVTVSVEDAAQLQTAMLEALPLHGGQDVEANLMAGEVELSSAGASVEDGTAVEISYQTQKYTVYRMPLSGDTFYLAPLSLIQYLETNAS